MPTTLLPPGWRRWLLAALLAGATAIAYLPTLRNGFVWDDDTSLTQNPFIRSGEGLRQFWLTTQTPDYWPVTSTSFWAEWRLWGMNPLGYHITNLSLHIVEALLLWMILRRLRIPGAYLAALLFAVHPVNVQTVAWITQRKNLMAMLFYLLSVFCFLRTRWYKGLPKNRSHKNGTGSKSLDPAAEFKDREDLEPVPFYWLSLAAFITALLSKGSVAMLPLVFLGLIAWRRRIQLGDFARLLPFFLVAGVLTGVDIWFQGHHLYANETIRPAGALERLLGAGAVVWFYLGKALLPLRLVFIYPSWRIDPRQLLWWLPLLATLGVTALLYIKGRTARLRSLDAHFGVANSGGGAASSPSGGRAGCPQPAIRSVHLVGLPGGLGTTRPTSPFLAKLYRYPNSASRGDGGIWRPALFAWGYFCVLLLPVMGFTDVYFMKFSLVADHYQHLALIGVTALAGAGWAEWRRRAPGVLPVVAAAAVAAVLAGLTWRQCLRYRDAETLFTVTLRENPGSAMAHNNLGVILAAQHRLPEALGQFGEALRLDAGYADAERNFGLTLAREGRAAESVPHYEAALRLQPNFANAEDDLGNALLALGRPAEAAPHFARAIGLSPGDAEAECNLGIALVRLGRVADAIPHYAAAVRLEPDNAPMHFNFAAALLRAGRPGEAARQYGEVLRVHPADADARAGLEAARAASSPGASP